MYISVGYICWFFIFVRNKEMFYVIIMEVIKFIIKKIIIINIKIDSINIKINFFFLGFIC